LKHLEAFDDVEEVRWGEGVFRGRVKNGMPHSHGMLTTDEYVIIGVVSGDSFGGICRICYPDGSNFKGDVRGKRPHGKGILYKAGEYFYEGEFWNGLKHGSGRLVNAEGEYTGGFESGLREGHGSVRAGNLEKKGVWRKDKVEGCLFWTITGERRVTVEEQYRNGEPIPEVKVTLGDETYVGEWRNLRFHGKGRYRYSNSDLYDGEWKDGRRHGRGTYTFSTGEKYVGMFKNNEFEDSGEATFTTPTSQFTGQFQSSVPVSGRLVTS
jgi:hypothetical protein